MSTVALSPTVAHDAGAACGLSEGASDLLAAMMREEPGCTVSLPACPALVDQIRELQAHGIVGSLTWTRVDVAVDRGRVARLAGAYRAVQSLGIGQEEGAA